MSLILTTECQECHGRGLVDTPEWRDWYTRIRAEPQDLSKRDPPPAGPPSKNCGTCYGRGKRLTDDGLAVLDLIREEINGHKEDGQAVAEVVHRILDDRGEMSLVLLKQCSACHGTGRVTGAETYSGTEEVSCQACDSTGTSLTPDGRAVANLFQSLITGHQKRYASIKELERLRTVLDERMRHLDKRLRDTNETAENAERLAQERR